MFFRQKRHLSILVPFSDGFKEDVQIENSNTLQAIGPGVRTKPDKST